MTTTTYDALQQRKTQLIQKALQGSVFMAAASTTLPTAITTGASSDLQTLPVGFTDIGIVEKKGGVVWGRKVNTAETEGWGFVEPVRRDIVSVETTVKFTMLETKKQTLGIALGMDLSSVTADSTTKEVSFAAPTRPATIYYRLFGLFVDGTGANTIYVAKLAPKVSVTDVGDEQWTDGDAVGREVTCTAYVDSTAGYSMKYYFGGPGWAALTTATDTGF